MAVCPSCGASSPEGSRFCVNCGARLEAAPVFITADTPVPKPGLTLPEVPAMDIPVPEAPAAGSQISAVPAFEAAPDLGPAPVPAFEDAPDLGPAPVPAFEDAPDFGPAPVPAFEAAPDLGPAPVPAFEAAPRPAPVFTVTAQEAPRPAPAAPVYQQSAPAAPEKPGKKSKYAPMTSWGMAIQLILMAIPFVGFVLMVVWACGGCRKIARRNLARANLILLIIAIVLSVAAALLARFLFADDITRIFEQILPGYTLQWG